MYFLVAGAVLFFGLHFYSAFRSRIAASDIRRKLGAPLFVSLYSIAAGIGFALMIWGYVLAKPGALPLYTPPAWGRNLAAVATLPALILVLAAYGPHNHIRQWTRHPMTLGVLIWAGAHLLTNGSSADAILFGGFFLFALASYPIALGRPFPVRKAQFYWTALVFLIGCGFYYGIAKFWHGPLFGAAVS